MSTRSLIGVYTNKEKGEWRGTYHHWDGYPTGLGKGLWDIYHTYYKDLLGAMVEFIIDAHPEGWSTLVGRDFTKRPTWQDPAVRYERWQNNEPQPPEAYKYRGEEAFPADQTSDFGQEWAYVFDLTENTMTILKCVEPWESVHYIHKATVPLTGTEPDWNKFE